jgi:hypothetical protein
MKKNWIVVQKLIRKSVPDLIEYCQGVITLITQGSYFNPPPPTNMGPTNPTLAEATAHVDALDAAYSAPPGGKLKTNAVNLAKDDVLADFFLLGNYVESVANSPANKEIGDVVIEAAGMEYKRTGLPKQRVFAVVNSPAQQGNIIARTVKAGTRAAYEWHYKKANEVNYQVAAITVQASYTYLNLQSGNRYQFRVKTIDRLGNANLSNMLELVVL